jgi:hypothetical protein
LTVECPRTEMFQLLFGGQLAPEQHGPLADHAATCASCHAVVEAMVTQQAQAQPETQRVTIGMTVGGRFRVEQVLGRGGMGIVVAATHLELGNRVAIKFMRDGKLPSSSAAERFVREARAVVKLRTEHVCRVLDIARLESGAPYIVMELLEGVDLARTIASRPLPGTIAVEYVMQAAVAVAEAHTAGIVHRDLKPANLFVTRRSDGGPLVKVLDFGIAKALYESDSRLTLTRTMLGTPAYMSPEQFESPRDVDTRTDIWALGVTLYQLLSGRLPFTGRNQTETAIKIASDPPPPLDVDPRLRAVVFRCLEKAREHRYEDVAALAADLVPFGGPRARRISATLGRVATQAVSIATPAVQPVALPQAATAATGATGATHASVMGGGPHAPVARGPVAPSGATRTLRIRTWRFAAALSGLAAAVAFAVVAAVLWHRDPAAPTAPVVAPTPAAPGPTGPGSAAPAASSPTAAPTGATPASPPARQAPAPSNPPRPEGRDAVRAAAGSGHQTRGSAHDPTDPHGAAPKVDDLAAQMKQACEAMTRPKLAQSAPPRVLVSCWCLLHDEARARQVYAKLTKQDDRDSARNACDKQGIELLPR